MKNHSSALSGLFSFTSQQYYLTIKALECFPRDCSVSLEKIGDIGIEGEINQSVELKNSMSSNNPISDTATDLWKTIYNWCKLFYDNEIIQDIEKYDLVILLRAKQEKKSFLIDKMKNCNNTEEISEIIEFMKNKTGIGRVGVKKLNKVLLEFKDKPKNYIYYINLLLTKEYAGILKKVICQFDYIISKESASNLLKNMLKRLYFINSDEDLEKVQRMLIGGVSEVVNEALDSKKIPIITPQKFSELLERSLSSRKIRRKYSRLLNSIDNCNVDEVIDSNPNFIKQLSIIGMEEQHFEAAESYLLMKLERESWIKKGYIENIDDIEINYLQDLIVSSWRRCQIKNSRIHQDVIICGQEIYIATIDKEQYEFDSEKLNPKIYKGFIHELANYDIKSKISIGWHPEYENILEKGNESE